MSHPFGRCEATTPKKVLIIDDDALICETVRLALVHEGYAAWASSDPEDAADEVRREMPDLIILDLYMPGVNGLDLCRAIKLNPETKHIPILIFTSSQASVDVISGLDAGAIEYIGKPVDGAWLMSKIRGILKK